MTSKEQISIYRKYCMRLYNISLRILGDAGEAEDVMQDTMLKYFSSGIRFESEAQVSSWLTKTCMHDSIDRIRKKRKLLALRNDYADPLEGYEEAPDAGACSEAVSVTEIVEEMMALPDDDRVVIDMILIEGLSYSELSGMTGVAEGTLRVRYLRARKRLADRLKQKIEAL